MVVDGIWGGRLRGGWLSVCGSQVFYDFSLDLGAAVEVGLAESAYFDYFDWEVFFFDGFFGHFFYGVLVVADGDDVGFHFFDDGGHVHVFVA